MINDCPIEGSFDGDQFIEHEKPYLLVRKVFLQPAIDISSLATYTSLDTCQMKLNYCPKKGNQAWTKSHMFYQRNKIVHDKQKSKEKTQAASRCCALLRQ